MIVFVRSPDEGLPTNITAYMYNVFSEPFIPSIPTQALTTETPVVLPTLSQAMVLLIFSGPSAADRRRGVRETWLQDASTLNMTAKFLIGTDGLNASLLNNLTVENEEFNDMLLFPDLHDSFHNLTLKLLKGILWAQSNVDFEYLMKADDDTYVRLDQAIAGVRNMKEKYRSKIHWGYFSGNIIPLEEGKYEEHNWFSCPNYLPYSLGACYVLAKSVVSMMVRFSEKLYTGYNNDDVSIGVWLAPYDIVRIHDVRFTFSMLHGACKHDFVASHVHDPSSLHDFRNRLVNHQKRLCERKIEAKFRYVYDWNLSPPKCCKARRNMQLKPFSATHSGFARNNRHFKLTE